MRERRKQPSKIVRYLIYNREGHNRRSYAQYSPVEGEAESSFSSSSSSSLSDDGVGEFNEAQRAELEEKARLILRVITRKEEARAAKEDERERQKRENGEKLLNLGDVSSDSEKGGEDTQLQLTKPPPSLPPPPRSPPIRRNSYEPTSSEEEETEEQAQERKAKEEEKRIRQEKQEKEREKEEEEDRKKALHLIDKQNPEEADLAHQAEMLSDPYFVQRLEDHRR